MAQVFFPVNFFEILKNTFFTGHLRMTASVIQVWISHESAVWSKQKIVAAKSYYRY